MPKRKRNRKRSTVSTLPSRSISLVHQNLLSSSSNEEGDNLSQSVRRRDTQPKSIMSDANVAYTISFPSESNPITAVQEPLPSTSRYGPTFAEPSQVSCDEHADIESTASDSSIFDENEIEHSPDPNCQFDEDIDAATVEQTVNISSSPELNPCSYEDDHRLDSESSSSSSREEPEVGAESEHTDEDSDEDLVSFELEAFERIRLQHQMSIAGVTAIYEHFKKHIDQLANSRLPSYKTIQRKVHRLVPTVLIHVEHKNLQTGDVIVEKGLSVYPTAKYSDGDKWRHMKTISRISFLDVLAYHKAQHKRCDFRRLQIDLSIDGVPEAKASTTTLEIVSIRFSHCNKVYPLAVGIGSKTESIRVTCEELLSTILQELRETDVSLRTVLADAPQRSKLRKQKAHSGYYVSAIPIMYNLQVVFNSILFSRVVTTAIRLAPI